MDIPVKLEYFTRNIKITGALLAFKKVEIVVLKKGCDFSPVTDNELEFIMDRLNNRPRKALDFSTPHEVFYASEYL